MAHAKTGIDRPHDLTETELGKKDAKDDVVSKEDLEAAAKEAALKSQSTAELTSLLAEKCKDTVKSCTQEEILAELKRRGSAYKLPTHDK